MQLSLLVEQSRTGSCPTVYTTSRGSIVIQGYIVDDPEALAGAKLDPGMTMVEVYPELLEAAARLLRPSAEGLRTGPASMVYTTGRGSIVIQGYIVDDPEALAGAKLDPGETMVEIGPEVLDEALRRWRQRVDA